MSLRLAASALCLVSALGACQRRPHEGGPSESFLQSYASSKVDPRCRSLLDELVRSLIEKRVEIPKGSDPQRAVVFDVIFPANAQEYLALNKFAILGIRYLSKKESDFPVLSVYYTLAGEPKGKLSSFPVFARTHPSEIEQPRSVVSNRVGLASYLEEIYVLAPMKTLRSAGDFGLRFNDKTSFLPVAQMPIHTPLPFADQDPQPQPDPHRGPDLRVLRALIARFYCRDLSAGSAVPRSAPSAGAYSS